MELPDDIILYDMQILGDRAYFCGKKPGLSSEIGVVGYVDLVVLDGTPVPSAMNVVYKKIPCASELRRLVAYKDTWANDRVVAIGIDRSITMVDAFAASVVVACEITGTFPYTLSYSYANSLNIVSASEQWRDIVYNGTNVILVGHVNMDKLIMRVCDPDNPTTGIIDFLHFYPLPRKLVDAEIRGTYMHDETIAVTYRGMQSANTTDYTHLRVFDISSMVNLFSQETYVPYKSYIHELTYLPTDKSIVLLQDFPSGGIFTSNFVYMMPETNLAYNTIYVFYEDRLYHSVDRYDPQKYIGAGNFHWLYRDKLATFPSYSIYPPFLPCPSDEKITVWPIDNIIDNIYNMPLTPVPEPPSVFDSQSSDVQDGTSNIDCYVP